MAFAQLIQALNGGEISPLCDALVASQKYASGCRTLENFLPTVYGPVLNRPGNEYLGEVKDSTTKVRLLPFVFSDTQAYQMEFGDGYVRFWYQDGTPVLAVATIWYTALPYAVGDYVTNGGFTYRCIVAHTSGTFATDLAAGKWELLSVLELPTPYAAEDLKEIQFAQINDLVYFTHPSYRPQLLKRIAVNDFEFGNVLYTWPPMLEESVDEILTGFSIDPMAPPPVLSPVTLTPSGTTGTITVTANTVLFHTAHIGAYFQIAHQRTTSSVAKTFAADGSSSTIKALGSWTLNTYGTWAATLTVERSDDGGSNWYEIRSFVSSSDRNVATTGTEPRECLLRLTVANRTVGGATDRSILTMDDSKSYGIVQIISLGGPSPIGESSSVANATVINDLYSTDETQYWAEGAWSDYRGYPRAIATHENRVYYGGTAYKPQSIWGSAIDDFQNFRTTVLADAGLFFTIITRRTNPIQWMISKDGQLQIGTLGGEGNVDSGDANAAISPDSIQWTDLTSYGSRHLPAVILNDSLFFVQKSGRKVRELAFDFNRRAYGAQDLTVLSEHITQGGIVDYATQQHPDAILWAIREDGQLLGLTYERDQQVMAWHRHVTDGLFESVSVIPGDAGDDVWFIVKRTINGTDKRYIERFRPDWRAAFDEADKVNWWYLDAAKRVVNGSPSASVTGLDHLEGKVVYALSDGAAAGPYTVTDGAITLEFPATTVLVGLPYVATASPMRLNLDLQDGSTRNRKARVARVGVQVLKTLGCEVSTDELPAGNAAKQWDSLLFRSTDNDMDDSPPADSAIEEMVAPGNYTDGGGQIWIRQTLPMPLCIVALVLVWTPTSN